MKRPLTDHEYQVNGGAWMPCTLSNTTNNGDGTYTITNGLNIVIPIGSLRVRVKSIGINPASSALENTVAFNIPISNDTPLFYINPIKTMAVGDVDQLLGYVSSSLGAVTFASSDTSKATIVVTDGNAYLHAVSTGDVTITANQAANGSYATATDACLGTIVVATIVDDVTYSTLAAGKVAATEGTFFNVADANNTSLRKYKIVGGKAVFQGVIPSTNLTTLAKIKERIYNQIPGIMPANPIVDFDSSAVAYHNNKIKSVGSSETLDFNVTQFAFFEPFTDNGTITVTPLNDISYQVDFVNTYSTNFATFLKFFKSQAAIPAGYWSLSMEIRLLSGDSGKSVYYGARQIGDGSTYNELPLTDTDQTLTIASVDYDTDTLIGNDLILLAARTGGVPATLSFIISNIRLLPGAGPGIASPLIKDVMWYRGTDYIPNGLNADLSFNPVKGMQNFNGTGNGLVTFPNLGTGFTIPEATVQYAIKMRHTDNPNGTSLLCDKGHNNYALFNNNEVLDTNTFFDNIHHSLTGFNMFGGEWLIFTVSYNSTGADMYLNGIRIMTNTRNAASVVSTFYLLLGADATGFRSSADISCAAFWGSKLSQSDINTAVSIMKERMRLKNHFLTRHEFFYIAEGDSITDNQGSYQRLVRDMYTPQLFGMSAAYTGAQLGTVGDNINSNTLYGRKAFVSATITDAISKGYKVVISILIGANDIAGLNSSSLTIAYYNSLMSYISDMRALGAKVIASTMTDQGGLANKTYINQLNELIRSDHTKYDGLADYFAIPQFNPVDNAYFADAPNSVHPNPAGQALLAAKLKTVMDTIVL
ncbi:GDSL-type esterase/lipase family protein [Mucilaginibacter flavus]|uniref:GDSL-type esterase/lipase family protein n=1 Tax=Mucilaginibacter flavus TaxID=931504 RepID=UPI0025B5ADA9|nr:GDSL-type esterase/lipase family protein [Mucilaginibacter flavus]MDN3582776.1 GDSL-type esterase/lipase family protein [Mucilaginibacter flavus]